MRIYRAAAVTVAALALTFVSACEKTTTSGGGAVACGDAPALICPSSGLEPGFTAGGTGTPTITPSGGTSATVSNSAYTVSGTTSAALNGWWLLVQNGTVRAFNVLTVSGGSFSGVIPLFCGGQQIYYTFSNSLGTSFYLVNVTLTGCSGSAAFRVQLTWDMDASIAGGMRSDQDLHLIRPSGTMFSSTNDCYFGSCKAVNTSGLGLDWGATGAAGNPVLDVDNTQGFGPENITIASGAEAGTYTIVVDNWNGSTNTHCTVRVFFNDVEAAHWTSQSMDYSLSHEYWKVATVNIQSGAITAIGTYSSSPPLAAAMVPHVKN